MKIAMWGSVILAAVIASGFGGYPPIYARPAALTLNRVYAQTPTVEGIRGYIHDAQSRVQTERERVILGEFEQVANLADDLSSGQLHDRLMTDIAAALERAENNETVIRVRGGTVDRAKDLSRELRSELRLPSPQPR